VIQEGWAAYQSNVVKRHSDVLRISVEPKRLRRSSLGSGGENTLHNVTMLASMPTIFLLILSRLHI
jgi:hypothetical protein